MHYQITSKNLYSNVSKCLKYLRTVSIVFPHITNACIIGTIKYIRKKAYAEILKTIKENPEYDCLPENEKEKLINDIILCHVKYGYFPQDYSFFRFDLKTQKERDEYLSHLEFMTMIYDCFTEDTFELFSNKGRLFELIRPFAGRDGLYLKDKSQLDECTDFLMQHREIFEKNINDYGGFGIKHHIVKEGTEKDLSEELIKKIPLLIEEKVVQHEKMAYLNSSSVNTLRVVTFRGDKDDESEPIFYALRVGREDSVVDNNSSGGMFIAVDKDTHKILPKSFIGDELFDNAVHPDSGKDFNGVEIPDWDELMCIIQKASKVFADDVHIFGWDFAYTENGWIIIEINDTPGGIQQFNGPYAEDMRKRFAPYLKNKKR